MDEKTAKIFVDLINGMRELSFDVNFCLAVLKEDEEINKFYEKCKKRFEEESVKAEYINEEEKKGEE